MAKRLPSVKYSLLQNSKNENFSKKLHTQKNGPSGARWKGEPFGEKTNFGIKVSQCRKTEKGDPLGFFNIHFVAKHQKIQGGGIFIFGKKSHSAEKTERGDPLGFLNTQSIVKHQRNWRGTLWREKKIRKKVSQCRKTERGDPLVFSNIHSVAKQQKIEGGTLWGKKISGKKSRSAKQNRKGGPLVSPGMVCYAGKQEKPFWFSSLDQIVHFGAIIFCRTFKNYFGQFVWIEKKEKPL